MFDCQKLSKMFPWSFVPLRLVGISPAKCQRATWNIQGEVRVLFFSKAYRPQSVVNCSLTLFALTLKRHACNAV